MILTPIAYLILFSFSESCPRISQTAVDNAEVLTMYDVSGTITKEIDIGTEAVIECVNGSVT